jgi:ADP-heptose:LPS heptosyltransferase
LRSISCKELAEDVLARCVAGAPPEELPPELVEEACGRALFGVLVEGLADRFEPALCDAYARLFAQAVAHVYPDEQPATLVARYERVRKVRPAAGEPRRVAVLSRVTLGADVAVTSVLMAAAKHRFPQAEILFAGPRKNYELFAGDARVRHRPVEYRRGGLRERLSVWDDLRTLAADPDTLVIDPDSRLTQLGLLPVCPEERYHLFESRAYGAESDRSLPELAAAWAEETLGVTGARPYVSIGPPHAAQPYITVNLGVGENPTKRLPDPFEEKLLRLLGGTGLPIVVDKGGSDEEAVRVERAAERSGAPVSFFEGSFAGFAAIVAGSRLYVGYDSAGQHVAAACGVPLISVFAGFPAPRMFDRWKPVGPGCHVIRVDRPDVEDTLVRVERVLPKPNRDR